MMAMYRQQRRKQAMEEAGQVIASRMNEAEEDIMHRLLNELRDVSPTEGAVVRACAALNDILNHWGELSSTLTAATGCTTARFIGEWFSTMAAMGQERHAAQQRAADAFDGLQPMPAAKTQSEGGAQQ